MKVAVYIRVSTEEQVKEGYSIDAQKQRLSDFIRSQGWELHDYYIDDGYSAKDLNRPNVQRMMNDIRAKKFDVVLVYRLDRLVRSVINLYELLQLFDRYDVKFKSATEMFDTTSAMGRFFITLVGAMAQWERENIGERVRMGMTQKHAEGGRNGAVAPFGYDLENGELTVNPLEAEVVKRLFSLYQQNNGSLAIAKRFNREGVPKREIGTWNYNTVYYILNNPVYCGKVRWNYRKAHGHRTGEEVIVEGTHEAIITEEEFNEVQRMRTERATDGKVATSDYPFTGVLRCGRCGHAMVGSSRKVKNGRKRFYRCLSRFNYGKCDMPVIAEESVYEAYENFIGKTNIADMLGMMKIAGVSEDDVNIEQLRTSYIDRLTDIERKKKRWHDAYNAEAITIEDLKRHTAEYNKEESYVRAEMDKLPAKQKSRLTTEYIEEQLLELKSFEWTKPENEEEIVAIKQYLNGTYEQITIATDATDIKGGPGRKVPCYVLSWEPKDA
jgi:site-specific DNA recombinase